MKPFSTLLEASIPNHEHVQFITQQQLQGLGWQERESWLKSQFEAAHLVIEPDGNPTPSPLLVDDQGHITMSIIDPDTPFEVHGMYSSPMVFFVLMFPDHHYWSEVPGEHQAVSRMGTAGSILDHMQ